MKTLDISTPRCPNAIVRVDDEDWDYVRPLTWCPSPHGHTFYAVCNRGKRNHYLHREIARARLTEAVDHVDGDGLNCQRANLRLCTGSQNGYNRKRRHGNSKYLGVHKLVRKTMVRWWAYITVDKKRISLGYFATEDEAAKARDAASKKHHGEFASLNFPEAA